MLRTGGLKRIAVVVDDFVNRLVANRQLNENPAINAGRKSSPAPYLKFQVSRMVCGMTGGPCKYTGKAMQECHAHLNITRTRFEEHGGHLRVECEMRIPVDSLSCESLHSSAVEKSSWGTLSCRTNWGEVNDPKIEIGRIQAVLAEEKSQDGRTA